MTFEKELKVVNRLLIATFDPDGRDLLGEIMDELVQVAKKYHVRVSMRCEAVWASEDLKKVMVKDCNDNGFTGDENMEEINYCRGGCGTKIPLDQNLCDDCRTNYGELYFRRTEP